MGGVYKRQHKGKNGTVRQGKVWWIWYMQNGRQRFETSRSVKKTVADRLLKRREGEIEAGKLPGVYFEKTKFDELADGFLRNRRFEFGEKSKREAEKRTKHLRPFFEGMRAVDITSSKIEEYTDKRIEEGAANATINRELAALKRMFKLGVGHTPPKVDPARIPRIGMLQENNVRKGFLEHGDYLALLNALPDYLKPILMFGYNHGWRLEEILGLTWKQVDLKNGIVRIEGDVTKNKEARTVYLDDEELEIFKKLHSQRQRPIPNVFLRDGEPIKGLRKAWNSACRKTKLGYGYRLNPKYAEDSKEEGLTPGPLFHDLRRTSVRNLVRANIPEQVAMRETGHKTRSVFERYNIVSDRDMQEVKKRRRAYLDSQETITKSITNVDFKKKGVSGNPS